jgi:hypothetical protein
VTLVVKQNKALDPLEISVFSAEAIVAKANGSPNLLQ